MKIALDWDGTVTHDVYGWLEFVKLFRNRGHDIWIVTMRTPKEAGNMEPTVVQAVNGVIFTSRNGKREAAKAQGHEFDIWIDDNPEAVLLHAEKVWSYCTPEGTIIDPSDPAAKVGLVRIDVEKCVDAVLSTIEHPQLIYKPL